MKAKPGKPKARERQGANPRRLATALGLLLVAAGLVWGAAVWRRADKSGATEKSYVPRPTGQVNFSKDIAPIIFQRCAECHRPGQSAPFNLLTFQDAKKHAKDIADVTGRRYMPPWLPEPGYGDFADEQRLSVEQIGLIRQWVAEGASEGNPADAPPLPQWSGDWQLGQPDLVVTMPLPYDLAAEGRDVYRNFVVPVSIPEARYVRGIEFHPGNPRIVHHAFIKVDRTAQSLRRDLEDAEPGFPGMVVPAEMPDGHMLGWQPGRQARMGPPGLPWRLDPGSALVVQTHLNPSGKPEQLQASVGLYFTNRPPTNTCFKLTLLSFNLDIPAGATNYAVEDHYELPVDVEVVAVLPHAHYLAKEMQGWATRPDGTQQWLLYIKQWDFNWQGDYRYAQPVFLPKGSTLSMRFTYDNSTNNPRNPNHPPQPVAYGSQSKDEMGELWFQLLPRRREDLARLTADYERKMARNFRDSDEIALRKNPRDAKAHVGLGMMLSGEGKLPEAEEHFRAALLAEPDYAEAHYHYGVLLRKQGRVADALAQFREDLRLNPKDFKAHGNLGQMFSQQGDWDAALAEFEQALRLNPDDALARDGRERALQAKRGPGK